MRGFELIVGFEVFYFFVLVNFVLSRVKHSLINVQQGCFIDASVIVDFTVAVLHEWGKFNSYLEIISVIIIFMTDFVNPAIVEFTEIICVLSNNCIVSSVSSEAW